MEKFASKCSVTGKGMNTGWVWKDGEAYYSKQEFLIEPIKKVLRESDEWNEKRIEQASEDELVQWAYDNEICYYTEWEEVDEDGYYLEDGTWLDCFGW
jgi:hypothetical protein